MTRSTQSECQELSHIAHKLSSLVLTFAVYNVNVDVQASLKDNLSLMLMVDSLHDDMALTLARPCAPKDIYAFLHLQRLLSELVWLNGVPSSPQSGVFRFVGEPSTIILPQCNDCARRLAAISEDMNFFFDMMKL